MLEVLVVDGVVFYYLGDLTLQLTTLMEGF